MQARNGEGYQLRVKTTFFLGKKKKFPFTFLNIPIYYYYY